MLSYLSLSLSLSLTLSCLLHEEPPPAQRAKGNNDETGERGRTTLWVVEAELLELLPCVHNHTLILGEIHSGH